MKQKLSYIFICVLSVVLFTLKISDNNFGKNGNYGLIDWDNFGYYLYLPATFIYDDLKLEDDLWVKEAQTKYDLSSSFYQAHNLKNGNRVIQYTSGMALLYSPAFFVGHVVANLTSSPADGFSKPYQIALLLHSFLILFLGLFYLRKLCLNYFSELTTLFILVVICLGTNYLQISAANISSPHVYLFTAYAFLLYKITEWHKNPTTKISLQIGVVAAIMVLSRPNELIFLIIPIFFRYGKFETVRAKFDYLLKNKKQLLSIVLPFVVFGLFQPLYWFYVTGDLIYDSYKNEDFKLLNPYLSEYLFSYKKGWLLYTPIMVVGLLGFIFTIKRHKNVELPIVIFLVSTIWVLSSWDCWWYADSFSQRSIVQCYPVFVFSFGYFFEEFNVAFKKLRVTTAVVISLLIALNIFQVWQFQSGIIHPKLMTKEYYWNIFGVTDIYEPNRDLLDVDRNINYLPDVLPDKQKVVLYESFEEKQEEFIQIDTNYYKREGSLILTKENPRSKRFRLAYKDIADSSYCYAVCRIRFKSDFEAQSNPFGIEFNMIDSYNGKGYEYKYRGAENISWFQKGSWSSMDLVVIPPIRRNLEDSIQFNVKLFGEQPVEIDNLSIEILDPAKEPPLQQVTYYNDYHTISPGQWSDPKYKVGEKLLEQIDPLHPYSSTFSSKVGDLRLTDRLELSTKINLQNNYSGTYAIASILENGKNIYYQSYPIVKSKEGWENLTFNFDLPKNLNPEGDLKVYIWNKSSSPTLIRSLVVKTF